MTQTDRSGWCNRQVASQTQIQINTLIFSFTSSQQQEHRLEASFSRQDQVKSPSLSWRWGLIINWKWHLAMITLTKLNAASRHSRQQRWWRVMRMLTSYSWSNSLADVSEGHLIGVNCQIHQPRLMRVSTVRTQHWPFVGQNESV